MHIHLEKHIPEVNCDRFYDIKIEPDLFCETALVIQWGRRGTFGNLRILASGDMRSVRERARSLVHRRLLRGYVVKETTEASGPSLPHAMPREGLFDL